MEEDNIFYLFLSFHFPPLPLIVQCPIEKYGFHCEGPMGTWRNHTGHHTLNKWPSVNYLARDNSPRFSHLPSLPFLKSTFLPSLCHRFFDDCGSVTEVIFARGCWTAADIVPVLFPPNVGRPASMGTREEAQGLLGVACAISA